MKNISKLVAVLFGIWVLTGHLIAQADELNAVDNSALASSVASEGIATLCEPAEIVVFSCSLAKKKIVSLCASQDASSDTGYMQYRFGRNPKSIELEYPHSRMPAKQFFKYHKTIFSKGGTAAISFKIGAFRYSLYDTGSAFGYNGSGVIVNRGPLAIRVAFFDCIGESISYNGLHSPVPFFGLERLGLPDAGEDISFNGAEPGPEPGTEFYHPKPGEAEDWQLRPKAN